MGTITHTRTHVSVGFANPYLRCDECAGSVRFWHDPDRCGCNETSHNLPCRHVAGVTSKCHTWNPVTGCECEDKETHDRPEN